MGEVEANGSMRMADLDEDGSQVEVIPRDQRQLQQSRDCSFA